MKKYLTILLFFLVCGGGCFYLKGISDNGSSQNYVVDEKTELLEIHNSEREKRNKSPLKINEQLNDAAQKHADWMAQKKKMSHREGLSEPWNRAKKAGYDYVSVGENIAYGQNDAQEVMKDWMHSRGHRRNILGNYEDVGFGIAESSNGQKYWCVVFGKQQNQFF